MNTSVETLTYTVGTVALGSLRTTSAVEIGLVEMNPKDFGRPWTANLAKAFHCSREAQRDERNGLPYTAAMNWRKAAELFVPETRAVEYCWCEWERIMQLPRRLAGPASVVPIVAGVI